MTMMTKADHPLVRRHIQMDPKRHRFHNKAALILTVATLVLLMTLSLLFRIDDDEDAAIRQNRFLEQANDDDNANDDNDDGDTSDFSRFSCRYIYDKVPEPGYAQCRFAKTCNGGEGVWAAWVFCYWNKVSVGTLFMLLSPVMILWMVTLFRLLGSTAEDYFSPSLEMFSVKLGLPPRFAGVSLLALGNGAADVSATMSAIVNDQENGYKLSLGALTGAAMLVGGVVSGIVVLVAGGVPCRGALVRDATALLVTVVVVWSRLSTGLIGAPTISLFFTMYGLFVCLVLVADIYHRAVVLPRLARAATPAAEGQITVADGETVEGSRDNSAVVPPPSALTRVMTAISNYDDEDVGDEGLGISSAPQQQRQTLVGPLVDDGPILLHGQHGILHGDGHVSAPAAVTIPESPDGGGVYTLVEDQMDNICATGEGTSEPSATNWSGGLYDCKEEVKQHIYQTWEDVAWNGDLHPAEKFLLFVEFPLTILRKITVPIPCEGYYNRGMIALSIGLSPLWFAYYIWSGHEINLLAKGSIFYFLIWWLLTLFVASSVLRFAPGGEGHMAMGVATPIALYGFVMAATWIDWVADHLVSLLDFMGIVLHIPGAIMGLTILAWGNSMGDLSANMTMARKGLANMAMTACFAGPIFNILMGLGLGFSTLAAKTGNPESAVALSAPIVAGFVFVILNCAAIVFTGIVLGKGRIETYYGYIAIAIYAIYVVTSISLQFSKYGDD